MSYIGRGVDAISNVEKLDNITFNGSSSYSLLKGGVAFTPVSANALLVSIDGVVQQGNFSVSTTNIVFDWSPSSSNTCNFILHYGTGVLNVPADGSISAAKMAANSVDSDSYVDASIDNAHLADDAVGVAELSATGTASSSTFLRGDNAWATPSGGAALTGSTNNTIPTVTGANAISGEANLTFDGTDLAIASGNVNVASGYGIDFSATSDGAGAATSELFDDYEEGTWTPTFGNYSGTPTISGARYTKIGRMVYAGLQIQTDGTSDGAGTDTSELFDDYEEGTWTPSFGGYEGTLTASHARYVKIGRMVYAGCKLETDGTADGSNAFLNGFPYTCMNSTNGACGAGIVAYTTGNAAQRWRGGNNEARFYVYDNTGTNLNYNDLGASKIFELNFIFEAKE